MHGRMPCLAVFIAVAVFAIAPAAGLPSLPARCTACQAIASSLQRRVEAEKPRNHLDMRHRLDSKGQRYGKQIEYKHSELRAVELLEGLCRDAHDYSLVISIVNNTDGTNSTHRHWVKVSGDGSVTLKDGQRKLADLEDKAYKKRLEVFCGSVMEDYEDELTSSIMKGLLDQGPTAAEVVLCQSLTKLCPVKVHEAGEAASKAGDEHLDKAHAEAADDAQEAQEAAAKGGKGAEL